MIETPVVIVVAMRPGPATGLPTRTAQEDLLYTLFAGHGEFPRVVLAPSDPLDAFHKTVKAFDLAEQYQLPVILLTDQFLADSLFSYTDFPFDVLKPQSHLADQAAALQRVLDPAHSYDIGILYQTERRPLFGAWFRKQHHDQPLYDAPMIGKTDMARMLKQYTAERF